MKKGIVFSLCALLLLSSCGTNTHAEQGAGNGAVFGSIFGSALGGIMGGPRGSDVGTLVGMVGGAMIGAAAGSAVDERERAEMEEHRRQIYGDDTYASGRSRHTNRKTSAYRPPVEDTDNTVSYPDESGFDPTGSGDDRIVFDESGTGNNTIGEIHIGGGYNHDRQTTVEPRTMSVEQLMKASSVNGIRLNPLLEIRNASFVDDNGDGMIHRGESCRITFDIMNNSNHTIYDIRPAVVETTGNKHILISSGVRVESIAPHRGVRYTATIMGDNRLKDGSAVIKVGVAQGDDEVASQVKEFMITTKKKPL
ncbi:MAG: hypothetical protein ACI4TW_07685 [Prevotella sp.]